MYVIALGALFAENWLLSRRQRVGSLLGENQS